MQIQKLSHLEIEIVAEYLQAMLDDMAPFGGHVFQDSDSGLNWLRDRIRSQIDSPDRLFPGIKLDAASSQLIDIFKASIANLSPVFLPKSSLQIHAINVVPEYRRTGVERSLCQDYRPKSTPSKQSGLSNGKFWTAIGREVRDRN